MPWNYKWAEISKKIHIFLEIFAVSIELLPLCCFQIKIGFKIVSEKLYLESALFKCYTSPHIFLYSSFYVHLRHYKIVFNCDIEEETGTVND